MYTGKLHQHTEKKSTFIFGFTWDKNPALQGDSAEHDSVNNPNLAQMQTSLLLSTSSQNNGTSKHYARARLEMPPEELLQLHILMSRATDWAATYAGLCWWIQEEIQKEKKSKTRAKGP